MIRTADDAAAYLEGLINLERDPSRMPGRLGLAPIRELMARTGHPERSLRTLHVAGSKGKGSVVLMTEALLRANGARTGAFTSPHLERWTERFRIDGCEVEGGVLAAAVAQLRPTIDSQRACGWPRVPSFFDATTAVAFLLFAQAEVDCALVEVGIGGRLDSTNVVVPVVTCITSIEREHQRFLGERIGGIAFEKAGILEPGVPCVVGALPPEANAVVEERAGALGSPLVRLGRDFEFEAVQRTGAAIEFALRFSDGFEIEAELPLFGLHHAHNASLAVACARQLGLAPEAQLHKAIAPAFAALELPGRVELLAREPWIVADGAHTEASARALHEALGAFPAAQRHFVLSVSADKGVESVLEGLLPGASSVTVTRADRHRSADPVRLARAIRTLRPELAVRVVPDAARALREARQGLGASDLLCATGSLYLAGIARQVFRSLA